MKRDRNPAQQPVQPASVDPIATLRTGPAARRAIARDLVASLKQDMHYLGWFLAIVEAYPDDQHNWSTAMQVAARCRFPLSVAEALLRIDHKSGSQVATGAKRQAMA